MNNFFTLAFRFLKLQKKRAALTILGVALAVALVASTGILISSFQDMMLTTQVKNNGDWHYKIGTKPEDGGKIPYETAQKITQSDLVEKAGIFAEDAYIKVGTEGDNYYNLKEYEPAALDMMPFQDRMVEGRVPENANELIISSGSAAFWDDVDPIGQQVTFDMSFADDMVIYQSVKGEAAMVTVNESTPRTFTIVGIYERFRASNMPNISEAMTLNPKGDHHAYSVYLQVKPVLNYESSVRKIMNENELNSIAWYEAHNSYLRWIGQGDRTVQLMFALAVVVLCAIILAAMTVVIKNAFSLSIADKINSLGILRCVGATGKQIRSILLWEGIIIWAVALPLGFLAAFLAMRLLFFVASLSNIERVEYLGLVLTLWPFTLATLASFGTILLSVWLPSKKVSSISPVEAIRGVYTYGSNEKGKVRVVKHHLLEKPLGYMWSIARKNITRSRSKYRMTVLSVVLSIALFVSFAGICGSVVTFLENYTQNDRKDFVFASSHHVMKEKESYLNAIAELKNYDEVEYIQEVHSIPYFAQVPVNRIPAGYEGIWKRYFRFDMPFFSNIPAFQHVGDNLKQLTVIPVSRETYPTLVFGGDAPQYDELVSSGGVLLCQTEVFRKSGTMSIADFANFQPGEQLTIAQVNGGATSPRRQVTIAGILTETPWFAPNQTGFIVIPMENFEQYWHEDIADIPLYTEGFIAISAKEDGKASLSTKLETYKRATFGVFNGYVYQSPYDDNLETNKLIVVVNTLTYGFIAVVALICCLNIFNTVSTNLKARRKDTSILLAVGMTRNQLWQSTYYESAIYAIHGTLIGGTIGVALLYLVTKVVGNYAEIYFSNPAFLLVLSLLFAFGIALLAAAGPIKTQVRGSMVDQIRAID